MSRRGFNLVAKDAQVASGRTWTIHDVNSSTTIQEVKEKLASLIGKSVSSITLACYEKNLIDNAKTLGFYKVRKDKFLSVWTRDMQSKKIILTWANNSLAVDVFENETVKAVIDRTKLVVMPDGSYEMTLNQRKLKPEENLYELVNPGMTMLVIVAAEGGNARAIGFE